MSRCCCARLCFGEAAPPPSHSTCCPTHTAPYPPPTGGRQAAADVADQDQAAALLGHRSLHLCQEFGIGLGAIHTKGGEADAADDLGGAPACSRNFVLNLGIKWSTKNSF